MTSHSTAAPGGSPGALWCRVVNKKPWVHSRRCGHTALWYSVVSKNGLKMEEIRRYSAIKVITVFPGIVLRETLIGDGAEHRVNSDKSDEALW